MFKTVLFPIDQSREAREAVEIVINIVKTYDSKLFLLSVVEKSAEDNSVMANEEVVAKFLASSNNLATTSSLA